MFWRILLKCLSVTQKCARFHDRNRCKKRGCFREYWMIYSGPAILDVVWFGSSPTPTPPLPSVSSTGDKQEDYRKRVNLIWLVLYKSFSTLWVGRVIVFLLRKTAYPMKQTDLRLFMYLGSGHWILVQKTQTPCIKQTDLKLFFIFRKWALASWKWSAVTMRWRRWITQLSREVDKTKK